MAVALIAFMIVQTSSLQLRLPKEVLHNTPTNDWVLSRLCRGGRPGSDVLWSDRPYYAFVSGLSEPPGIAVVTGDRFASGKMAEPDILANLEASHPRFVLLRAVPERLHSRVPRGPGQDLPSCRELPVGTARGSAGEIFRPLEPAPAAQQARRSRLCSVGGCGVDKSTSASVPAQLTAGQCLGMGDLSWSRPEDTLPPDLALSLRLVDSSGETWFQHDKWLANDWNTLKDRTSLSSFVNPLLPEGTPPGDYTVALIVYDRASGEPLAISRDGESESDRLALGRVHVSRPSAMPSKRPAAADFSRRFAWSSRDHFGQRSQPRRHHSGLFVVAGGGGI